MPTNCLIVFDHLVGLVIKGLNVEKFSIYQSTYFRPEVPFSLKTENLWFSGVCSSNILKGSIGWKKGGCHINWTTLRKKDCMGSKIMCWSPLLFNGPSSHVKNIRLKTFLSNASGNLKKLLLLDFSHTYMFLIKDFQPDRFLLKDKLTKNYSER